MELIAKERDRLLQRTSRLLGTVGSGSAIVCLTLPGTLTNPGWLASFPLFVVVLAAHWLTGSTRHLGLILAGLAAGVGVIVLALVAGVAENSGFPAAASLLAGVGMASFGLLLTTSALRRTVMLVAGTASTVLVQMASVRSGVLSDFAAATALGWVLTAFCGYWLSSSVPHAARRIQSIGRAHRAERQASETEAQRRQSARLLHDTVLATLTLLAHSGVGVSASALRQQAADDARLLRQLRLGATPAPHSSGQYTLEPVRETTLGTTLESVKHRFGRMGLEVSWHGTGQVLLPRDVLDAFLMSLAECLENVRRHSGVNQAHVTITDDESTVRALVTDSGVGFDIDMVDDHKLGFRESVVGRLSEVGGAARLFSSPGQGTTVVIEVPK